LSSDSKWDALQPISKKILSMWFQTDKEDFLAIRDVVKNDEIDLEILNECITHVREHKVDIFNSFCKQDSKKTKERGLSKAKFLVNSGDFHI
jgi:hypothetical protein